MGQSSFKTKKKYFSCELRSSGIHLKLHLQPECNLFSFELFHFVEPWTLTVEISFKKKKKTVTEGFIDSVPLYFKNYLNTRSAGHLHCVSTLSSSLGIVTFY